MAFDDSDESLEAYLTALRVPDWSERESVSTYLTALRVPDWSERESALKEEQHEISTNCDTQPQSLQTTNQTLPPTEDTGRIVSHLAERAKLGAAWTDEEDCILLEKRSLGLNHKEIVKFFPGRTVKDCTSRLSYLVGRPASSGARWTAEEDRILTDKRKLGLNWKEVAEHLPGRSEGACRLRKYMQRYADTSTKPSPAVWTMEEEHVAKFLHGQTAPAFAAQFQRHIQPNLFAPYRANRHWTAREDTILEEKCKLGMSWRDVAEYLPGRDKASCTYRFNHNILPRMEAMEPPYTPLTAESIGFKHKDIAKYPPGQTPLGACRDGLRHAEMHRGLSCAPQHTHVIWTDKEDCILEEKRKLGMPWREVAEFLPGRTGATCAYRYNRHLLPRIKATASSSDIPVNATDSSIPQWTAKEDGILQDKRSFGLEYKDIAAFLPGRTEKDCEDRFRRHLQPKLIEQFWAKMRRRRARHAV